MGKVIHSLESTEQSVKMTRGEKLKYLCYFFTRAFFLSILVVIVIIGSGVLLYLGDLFFNVKSGNYKSPLFGAYIIVSQSMVPTINVNDAIVVTRTNYNILDIGDIITFSSTDASYSGLTVTHRIVGKQFLSSGELVYRTKGDNNSNEDKALVKSDNIYGKVVFKIPKLGYIQSFLSKPIGFLSCILIPAIIVIVLDTRKIILSLKKNNELNRES